MTPQQANELLRTALKRISETRFGYDGDCGVTSIADEALEATADCTPAPTEPAVDRDAILEEAAALFSQPHMEYFGCNIQEDIRALKLATPASPAVPARDHLLKIIAFAYQIAGWHDAPEHILAVLAHPESATAAQVDSMLPYQVGTSSAAPGKPRFKDHDIRQLVNDLRAIAIEFHAAGQLRERISGAVQQFLAAPQVAQASQPTCAEELQPCQNAAHMGEFACANRAQCWEPCGELGHSKEHAKRAPTSAEGEKPTIKGICCYGGPLKPKSDCASCAAWQSAPTSAEGKDSERLEGGA